MLLGAGLEMRTSRALINELPLLQAQRHDFLRCMGEKLEHLVPSRVVSSYELRGHTEFGYQNINISVQLLERRKDCAILFDLFISS